MIGTYIRLSDQDDDCRPGEKAESNSIANQRSLLDHYIAAHADLAAQHTLEFIDDGHTGTNFDRPGVQALFASVKRGEIDCIIVKDLSRFGRNSVEVNEYLERIFPLLQVRFIAVNDGLDSSRKQYGMAGDLDVGIRSLMNEMYSRNVSTNVRTAKRQYAARGECIAAYPFYGYVKGSENRRQLEIDPPAADIVRMIFSQWLEGCSRDEIAAKLNARNVPSPSTHKRQLGVKRTSWSKRRETVPWTEAAVRTILQNERYTGKLISLQSTRTQIGRAERKAVPKEDWIVVPDVFQPIIDEITFQKAQALFRRIPPRVRCETRPRPLFSLKVFCGVCGMGLEYRRSTHSYYKCKAPQGPLAESCRTVRITEDDLKAYVLSEMRRRIAAPDGGAKPVESSDNLQEQIATLNQKIEKQWSAKKDAFVKWNGGLISKTEYDTICAERQRKIQQFRLELEKLNGIIVGNQVPEDDVSAQLAHGSEPIELTRELLDTLIHAVRVFDGGQIEIEWKDQPGSSAVDGLMDSEKGVRI